MADIIKNNTIYRNTCTLANTEYSQVVSDRTTKLTISADNLTSIIFFSFTSGGSALGKAIFAGAEYTTPGFVMGSKTVYFQSPTAGTVVVIEEWDRG